MPSRHRRRLQVTAIVAAVVVLGAMTACDPVLSEPFEPLARPGAAVSTPPEPTPDASSSPERTGTVPPSPAASPSDGSAPPPSAAPVGPRLVPGPPELPAARTAGLVPHLAAMRGDGFTAFARWATPPGSSPLGDALTDRVATALRSFAGDHGVEWSPGVDLVAGGVDEPCRGGTAVTVAASRLAIDCTIVVASGGVVGERLVVHRTEEAAGSEVVREVRYSDAASGTLVDGTGLYAADAAPRVLALVAEGLRSGGRIGPGAHPFDGLAPDAARAMLADSVVAAEGIVVTVDVPGAERAGTESIHLPRRLLEPFLSDVGRSTLSAAASGEPYAPPAVPAAGDPVDCTLVPCASITFDDGPTSLTPGLLDLLDRERAPATFFLLGASVTGDPETAARAVAAGHEVGNHTWGHPDLTKLTDREVRDQVRRTQDAIEAATGIRPRSLRPPYGASNGHVRDLIGLPFVVWDVDTRDWQDPGVEVVADRAVSGARPGSIVLMHDTHADTIEAVPAVIAGLRGRGFALATVSGQFGGALPGRGSLVSHGPR